MKDPYATLDIDSSATSDEIRAAYRRLARTLHPDRGGGVDEMAALTEARDLLLDEERRAHFDATGKMDGRSQSQDMAAVTENFVGLLSEILEGGTQPDFDGTDIGAWLKKILDKKIEEADDHIAQFELRMRNMQSLRRRLKRTKQGKKGDAFLIGIDSVQRTLKANYLKVKRMRRTLTQMWDAVDQYEYLFTRQLAAPSGMTWVFTG